MRFARCLGGALIAVVLAEGAALATPSAKLVYIQGANTQSCPGETELRKAVAARLGYDPFFVVAPKTVIANVTREPVGYRARVQLVGDDGALRGERELTTKGEDCSELVYALALAVSLAVDDLEATTSAPSEPGPDSPTVVAAHEDPPPAEPNARVGEAEPRQAPPPPPAGRGGPSVLLSAGPAVTVATAPAPAVAGELSGALRWRRLALRIDGRADLPAGTGIGTNGRVATTSAVGLISACLHGALLFACAGAGGGAVFSRTSSIAQPATDGAPVAVAAVRGGLFFPVQGPIYLEPALEAGASVLRHRILVDNDSVYRTGPVWGAATVHVGANFL